MFRQLWTISRNTFDESIRQPIYAVLVLVGTLLLAFTPSFSAYTLEHGRGDNKMMIDIGLGTLLMAGTLLAAFTATGVLSQEIERKTVLTVIAKPVSRPLFVLGKFLGVLGAIAVAYYVLSLAFVMIIRHGVMQTASDNFDLPVLLFGGLAVAGSLILAGWGNYAFGWVFTSTLIKSLAATGTASVGLVLIISPQWALQWPTSEFTQHAGQLGLIVVGLVLIFEAVAILTAVAVAASTRLGQVLTLLIALGVYALGIMSGSANQLVNRLLGIQSSTPYGESLRALITADSAIYAKAVYGLLKLLYVLAPNLQFLYPADAITQQHPFDAMYVLSVSGYAAMYTAVVLCVAVMLFQTREVS